MPSSPVEVSQRFEEIYCFHLQCQSKKQMASLFLAGYFLGILFDPEDGGSMFLRIVNLYQTTRLHILFFLFTAVMISNPAYFNFRPVTFHMCRNIYQSRKDGRSKLLSSAMPKGVTTQLLHIVSIIT
jgi:hypothetical protein